MKFHSKGMKYKIVNHKWHGKGLMHMQTILGEKRNSFKDRYTILGVVTFN